MQKRWQVIVGIKIGDKIHDYCRETLLSDIDNCPTKEDAKALIEERIENLVGFHRPPKGELFVKRVENW